MLHRFDIHTHTFFSKDGVDLPERLIQVARQRGLSGIVITDHNTCEAHDYLLKKGLEREDGEPVDGFLVIPGVEVSTAEGHLLCIGTTLPNMLGRPAKEVCSAILERGGIPIPAHPYDKLRAGIHPDVLDTLPIRLIESFNAAISWKKFNQQAADYAQRRGLIMTAGSDAHHATAVGTATIGLELDTLDLSAFMARLPIEVTRYENYLTFREGMKKHLGNWFRIFNPKPRT